jgi:hypothetical protein
MLLGQAIYSCDHVTLPSQCVTLTRDCPAPLPAVTALPEEGPFPDISFKVFSQFVKDNFSSKTPLSSVLLVLFTMTDNTDALSLHARQNNPVYPGESAFKTWGWIRGLAHALYEKLGGNGDKLFKKQDIDPNKSINKKEFHCQ